MLFRSSLIKENDRWRLLDSPSADFHTRVVIPAEIAWQLLTKAIRYEEVKSLISIQGEQRLALPALEMVSVMA